MARKKSTPAPTHTKPQPAPTVTATGQAPASNTGDPETTTSATSHNVPSKTAPAPFDVKATPSGLESAPFDVDAPAVETAPPAAAAAAKKKKNRKKKPKAGGEPHPEGEGSEKATTTAVKEKPPPIPDDLQPEVPVEDPLEAGRQQILADMRLRIQGLPQFDSLDSSAILANAERFRRTLDDIEAAIPKIAATQSQRTKKPDQKKVTSQQVIADLAGVRKDPDVDENTVLWYETQLKNTYSWENFKKFQSNLQDVKKECEELRRQGEKSIEDARHTMNRTKTIDRLQLLWSHRDEAFDESAIATQVFEPSADAWKVLFAPYWIMGKLERQYACILDRPQGARSRNISVTGMESDVTACLTFMRTADFTGKQTITLDTRTMGPFIGKGGAGVRRIEDENNVCIHSEGLVILVYGTKENYQKVVNHIQKTKTQPEEADIVVDSAIARAVPINFKTQLKDLNTTLGVTVRTIFNGADGRGRVLLKGKPEPVAQAKAQVEKLVAQLVTVDIAAQPEAIKRVLSNSREPPDSMLRVIFDDFAFLRETSSLVFSKHPKRDDILQVVGLQAEVARARTKIETLVKKASYTPHRIHVLREQLKCFNEGNLSLIETQTDTTIALGRGTGRPEKVPVDLLGDDAAKREAETMIEAILQREGFVEKRPIEEDDVLNALTRQRVSEFESTYGINFVVDRQGRCITCVGPKDSVSEVMDSLRLLEEEIRNRETRTVDIDPAKIPVVIGRKGTTIANIRNTSGVEKLDIRDEDSTIVIVGSSKAINTAMVMINEVLVDGPRDAPTPSPEPARRSPRPVERSEAAPAIRPAPAPTTDYTAFPSLGDATRSRMRGRDSRGTSPQMETTPPLTAP